MFDPTKLSPEQRSQIIESLKQSRNDPFTMLKLKTMQSALILKRWIEENAPQHQNRFQTMWSGFENQLERHFKESEQELLNRVGFHGTETGTDKDH